MRVPTTIMIANCRDARFGFCLVCPIQIWSATELEHALSLSPVFLSPMLLSPPFLELLLLNLLPLSLLPSSLRSLVANLVVVELFVELFAALAVDFPVAVPLEVSALDVAPMFLLELTIRGKSCFQGPRTGSLKPSLVHSLLLAL